MYREIFVRLIYQPRCFRKELLCLLGYPLRMETKSGIGYLVCYPETCLISQETYQELISSCYSFKNKSTEAYICSSIAGRHYKGTVPGKEKHHHLPEMLCLYVTSLVVGTPCDLQTPYDKRTFLERFDPGSSQENIMGSLQKQGRLGLIL